MIEIEITNELLAELVSNDLNNRKKYLFKIQIPYLQYLIGTVVKYNDKYIKCALYR